MFSILNIVTGKQIYELHSKVKGYKHPLLFLLCSALLVFSSTVYGHGRLREPLSRSSMWRDIGDPSVAPYADIIVDNYNDNQLFCGGFQVS